MSAATTSPESITGNSLGYGIAVAISVVVLISIIVFASYACIRVKICSNEGDHGGEDRERQENRLNNRNNQHPEPIKMVLGLEKPVIETYTMIELGQSRRLPRPNNGPCSICLSDYCVKDKLRCIPECNHCFHARCIDQWLQMNGSCPLCRNSPAATPLTQFVPLTYHSR